MWTWLVRQWHWPAASLFAAAFLLALVPLIGMSAGAPLALVVLQLPLYMLHQGEEHTGDRFRLYVNGVLAGGREALTPGATFWINCLGVWLVDLAAIYLAWCWTPAAGLAAGYLALVNALLHVAPALARRQYNPGLITACLLFVPFGACCVMISGAGSSWQFHLGGLAVAIGVHLAVIAHVATRLMGRRAVGQASGLPSFSGSRQARKAAIK